jgi:hypothetical protein
MKNKKLILAAIGSSLCLCTSLVEAQSINVALDRNSAGATPVTFATSALGYDAADTFDSGTTWNNVYNQGGVGLNTSLTGIVPISSPIGSYPILYNVPLVDSSGAATAVTVSATIVATSVDGHGEYNNASPAGGVGILLQVLNITCIFMGLEAVPVMDLHILWLPPMMPHREFLPHRRRMAR